MVGGGGKGGEIGEGKRDWKGEEREEMGSGSRDWK